MTVKEIPDRSIRICADRGGTFCDIHACVNFCSIFTNPERKVVLHSSYPDPENPSEQKELVVKLCARTAFSPFDTPGVLRYDFI